MKEIEIINLVKEWAYRTDYKNGQKGYELSEQELKKVAKTIVKKFDLYAVGCSVPTEKEIAIEAERRHPYKKHFVDYNNGMHEGFIDGTDFVLEAIKKTK